MEQFTIRTEIISRDCQPAGFRTRLAALAGWKTAGVSGFMATFFLGYFWALRHPIFPVHEMPWTQADDWIPFQPAALVPYLSLWIFVLTPAALIDTKSELARFAGAATGLAIVGLGIFVLWPTRVPALTIVGADNWAVMQLKQIDAAGNACPSLHVAFAIFAAGWSTQLLRVMSAPRFLTVILWLWCAAIIYSTMATRQHVAWDVVAGALLGAFAAILFRSKASAHRPSDAIIASG